MVAGRWREGGGFGHRPRSQAQEDDVVVVQVTYGSRYSLQSLLLFFTILKPW